MQQDAEEIWASVRRVVSDALDLETAKRVVSLGLSTQRESCVIWDRRTGEALTPVLSWQDQRTEAICAALRAAGHGAMIRRRSGLPLDPMFSAAKARWLLDRLPQGRARAKAGEICLGTIDAFLLSRFGGEAVVEAGNASRTQLFDVVVGKWDDDLLTIFDVPLASLPRVVASNGPFPKARGLAPLADGTPIGAVLADSHSALFAHGAFAPGPVKATQGTGSSIMGLVDRAAVRDGDAGAPGVCLTFCVAAGPVDARLRRQHPQRRRDLDLGRGTARNLRERARRARRHCSRTRVASPSCPPSEALARRGGTPTPPRPRLASRLARRARLLRELLWIRLPTRLPMWWTPSAQAAHQSNGC